jgi:serine/threonine-protein kinase
MGTPYYMSPEQAKGNRDIDLRADLYAVGVILYEAVAGEVPFNAETFNELLFKIVLESPTPLVDKVPGMDPYFASIVEKAMARDPAHRFQTAAELSDAISGWLAGAPPAPDITVRAGTPAAFDRTALGMAGQPSQAGGAAGSLARSSSGKIAAAAQTNAGEPAGAHAAGVGRATQGAWAATGDYGSSKSNTTKIIVAAAALLVLAIGGGAAMVLKSNQAEETARATAAAKVEEERAAAEKLAHEQARLEAERSRAEAEKAKAEQARLVQEKDMTAAQLAELKKLEAERAEAERVKAEAAGRPRPAAPRPASPRPTPAVTPSAPAAPASTGRVIRQDL